MARRNRPRRRGRPTGRDHGLADTPRPVSLGVHWRADGQPKSPYRSQGEALSVADERRAENGVELHAYRCEICRSWHLGNAGGRRL